MRIPIRTYLSVLTGLIFALGLAGLDYAPTFADAILHVPEIAQEHSQWCWAGSGQATLDYYLASIPTQCAIANWAWGRSDCCGNTTFDWSHACNQPNYMYGTSGSLQAILTHWGVNSDARDYALSQVTATAEINAGRPFIMRFGWTSGGGHFLVGRGIIGNNLYYMDPWPGNGYTISTYSWVVSATDHNWTHTLQMTTAAPDDGYEQNDTLATAYMGLGEGIWLNTISGLGIQGDYDWYRIYVDPAGYECVKVDAQFTHADGDIDMVLYNASGNLLASSTFTDDDEFIEYRVPSAGYYYVRVSGYPSTTWNTYNLWWDDLYSSAPSGVSASDGTYTSYVRVAWNSVTNCGGYYRVYRNTTNNSGTATALGSWQSSLTYYDYAATPGVTYYYWVKAATVSSGTDASAFSTPDIGWIPASYLLWTK